MIEDKWTAECIAILQDGVARKISAPDIAERIRKQTGVRFTRNAIAGKIFRLRASEKKPASKKPSNGKVVKIRKNTPEDLPAEVPLVPLGLPLEALKDDSSECRWICAEPPAVSVNLYCGLPTWGRASWCPLHAKPAHIRHSALLRVVKKVSKYQ